MHEGRELQPQSRAVVHRARGMMVPDDLDRVARLRDAVAMMKKEAVCAPGIKQRNGAREAAVVVAREHDDLALRPQPLEQRRRRLRGGVVVHQVAYDHEPLRSVAREQFPQPLFHRGHAPHRHHSARRALAQLEAKVEIGHRQPALRLMEKRQAAVEQNPGSNERLVRQKGGHAGASGAGLKLAPGWLGRYRGDFVHLLKFPLILALAALLASCATQTAPVSSTGQRTSLKKVRTTAYTHSEGTGGRNATGQRLSGGRLKSAASDWSVFPLGTRFRVLSTGDEYVIDDYGGALVGTNTIDLYKPSRLEMHRWGVRHEDIEIIHWGSDLDSLKVLRPRSKVARVRRMIAGLEKKQQIQPGAR